MSQLKMKDQDLDSSTKKVHRVLSAYFVNIFYQHLYRAGSVLFKNNNKIQSHSDGYRHAMLKLLKAVGVSSKKTDKYGQLVRNMHNYFETCGGYQNYNISEIIKIVTNAFVPQDYQSSLTSSDRNKLLHVILIDSIKDFTTEIAQEYINIIIDAHDDASTPSMLKEVMRDILLLRRQKIFMNFLNKLTKVKSDEKVNGAIIKNLRNDNIKLHKGVKELQQKLAKLNNLLKTAQKIIKNKNKEIKNLKCNIEAHNKALNNRTVPNTPMPSPSYTENENITKTPTSLTLSSNYGPEDIPPENIPPIPTEENDLDSKYNNRETKINTEDKNENDAQLTNIDSLLDSINSDDVDSDEIDTTNDDTLALASKTNSLNSSIMDKLNSENLTNMF